MPDTKPLPDYTDAELHEAYRAYLRDRYVQYTETNRARRWFTSVRNYAGSCAH